MRALPQVKFCNDDAVCISYGVFYRCGHYTRDWVYCRDAERRRFDEFEACEDRKYHFIEDWIDTCAVADCWYELVDRRWQCCECEFKPNRTPTCEGKEENGMPCNHHVCQFCHPDQLPRIPIYDPAIGDWR
ncbi:hypothetical protein F5B20DRAFT_584089 [Whalleya microplaca]|nr:hypothetical protein F5B20DRAFT_584089 [Whalleya microplaca]